MQFSDLGLPAPPTDVPYNVSGGTAQTIGSFIVVCLILVYSLWVYRKTKDTMPLLITIGSAFISITEVIIDVIGCVYYPTPDKVVFNILGRDMGWFIIVGWCVYGALVINMFYHLLKKQVPAKNLWIAMGIAAVLEIILEETSQVIGGIYLYYGNQPLVIIYKLPWWWIPCNVGGAFLAACIVYYFRDSFKGIKSLIVLTVPACAMCAGYALIAIPAWIVVNGEYPWLITQAAGLLTIALGIITIGLEIKLFTKQEPFALKKTSAS